MSASTFAPIMVSSVMLVVFLSGWFVARQEKEYQFSAAGFLRAAAFPMLVGIAVWFLLSLDGRYYRPFGFPDKAPQSPVEGAWHLLGLIIMCVTALGMVGFVIPLGVIRLFVFVANQFLATSGQYSFPEKPIDDHD